MSVMIVGADHLGNIARNQRAYGLDNIEHVSGRNAGDRKKFSIPKAISLVVVLIDYLNHPTASHVKEQAKSQGIPMIFAKRSWCSIAEQLQKNGFKNK